MSSSPRQGNRLARLVMLAALVAGSGLAAQAASAADVFWNNAAGGNWNVAGNWTGGTGVPGPADNAIINLNGTYTVTLDTSPSINSITIGGGTGTQTLFASSRSLTLAAASLIASSGRLELLNSSLAGTANVTNQGFVLIQGACTAVNFSPGAGSTLRVEGSNQGTGTYTVANGFTNNGTIELTSAISGFPATLNVTNGTLTNAVGRAINVQPGVGGARTLSAQLDNQGTLTVNADLGISKGSADHTNSGTIDLAGANLTISQSGTTPSFTNTGTVTIAATRTLFVTSGSYVHGAVLAGTGTLDIANLTATLNVNLTNAALALNLSNCTINGPQTLVSAAGKTLSLFNTDVNAATDNQGTLVVQGACTADGAYNHGNGATLRVLGSNQGTGTYTVANGFTNNGTIELTSAISGFPATLNVTAGTLTNAATRSINVLPGVGGGRTLNAQLDNQGALTVNADLGISKASADHTNSGTIDLAGANLTISQSGTTPSFTNTGTLTIAATRTLFITSGSYVHGAVLAGTGTLDLSSLTATLNVNLTNAALALNLSNCTIDGPQTLVSAAGKTLSLFNTDVNAATDNQGTLVVQGACTADGAYNHGNGATLRVQGSNQGTGTYTVANGFTNNGTIELTSAISGFPATLNVTAGTLTNAVGRAINVQPGVGGGRTLNAQIDNQGTIGVGATAAINKGSADHVNTGSIDLTGGDLTISQTGVTPSFTNTGTVTIAATRTLFITSGSYVHGAVLAGTGTLDLSSLTATLNVNLTNAALALNLSNCTINGPQTLVSAAGKTLSLFNTDVNAATDNQGTLVVQGACTADGAYNHGNGATLRVQGSNQGTGTYTVANGFTNNGTIELTSAISGFPATLTVTAGTLTNAATRSINVLPGVGGGRTLSAQLDNQGTLTVNADLGISKASADHTNSGTIDLAGANLTISQSGTTPSFTNTGTLTIAATRTLFITSGSYVHGAVLAGTGTLDLSSLTATLNVNLTNAALALNLSNCTIDGPQTLVSAAGKTLSLFNTDVNAATDNQGTLVVQGACTADGAYNHGNGATLRVQGSNQGTGTYTVANGFTNNGTIELTSAISGFPATLNVTAGTLVNASGRAINVLPGVGGARTIGAQLDNQGTITVMSALTISKTAADHLNSGTIDLAGADVQLTQNGTTPTFTNTGIVSVGTGRTLTVSSGAFANAVGGSLRGSGTFALGVTTFTNAGNVSPGASPGLLAITGILPQVSSSSITIELGGTTPGTGYDRLSVTGAATFGGTIQVSLVNGFVPQAGDQFQILTFGSSTGIFDGGFTGLDLGGGLSLEPRYSATGLTLLTVSQTWIRLIPLSAKPAARNGHSGTYHAASNRMTIFAGNADGLGPMNDVWVLTNANGTGGNPVWSALAPTGGPPAIRTGHTAVYAQASNRMVIYGGDDATTTPTEFGDVWVLTNANGLGGAPVWSQLSPTGTPPVARTQHSAVYDEATNRMIVFGGNPAETTCDPVLNDVWVLTNANGLGGTPAWIQLLPTGGPPSARRWHVGQYDAANNRMIVFGGDAGPCGSPNEEVWALTNANGLGGAPIWSQLAPTGTPLTPWSRHRGGYDPGTNRLTVFGGNLGGTPVNDVRALSGANGLSGTPNWFDPTPTNFRPAARSLHSATMDLTNHKMIVFGGFGTSTSFNDTWVLEQAAGRVVDVPELPVVPRLTGFERAPSPNPSRGQTTFSVSVARDQRVDITIYDMRGRRVAVLHEGPLAAGVHPFSWQGTSLAGSPVAAGIYLVQMLSEDSRTTQKVCILK